MVKLVSDPKVIIYCALYSVYIYLEVLSGVLLMWHASEIRFTSSIFVLQVVVTFVHGPVKHHFTAFGHY